MSCLHCPLHRRMRGSVACGLAVLLLDLVLCVVLWAILVLLQCSSCCSLAGLWAFAAVKWFLLCSLIPELTGELVPVVLHRLSALLCLLSPVLESGRVLLDTSGRYVVPHPDPSMVFLGLMSSALACVVWELGLSVKSRAARNDSNVKAWPLLLRMLKYF